MCFDLELVLLIKYLPQTSKLLIRLMLSIHEIYILFSDLPRHLLFLFYLISVTLLLFLSLILICSSTPYSWLTWDLLSIHAYTPSHSGSNVGCTPQSSEEIRPIHPHLNLLIITLFLRRRVVPFSFFINLVYLRPLLLQTFLKSVAPGFESVDHLSLTWGKPVLSFALLSYNWDKIKLLRRITKACFIHIKYNENWTSWLRFPTQNRSSFKGNISFHLRLLWFSYR